MLTNNPAMALLNVETGIQHVPFFANSEAIRVFQNGRCIRIEREGQPKPVHSLYVTLWGRFGCSVISTSWSIAWGYCLSVKNHKKTIKKEIIVAYRRSWRSSWTSGMGETPDSGRTNLSSITLLYNCHYCNNLYKLTHCILKHEIVSIRLMFGTSSSWARFVPEMCSGALSCNYKNLALHRENYCTLIIHHGAW